MVTLKPTPRSQN